MSELNKDGGWYAYTIADGNIILEFKCRYYSKQRLENSFGELAGYSEKFYLEEKLVHIFVEHARYMGVDDVQQKLIPLLFEQKTEKSLSYYSDFEFVRAITIDRKVNLQ